MTKELTRVPTPFTHKFDLIEQNFGFQSQLITDILIYVANNQIENLFGSVVFDLQNFCHTMGYKKSNLQRKIAEEDLPKIFRKGEPKPIYKNNTGQQYIENYFEIALHQCVKNNIVFQKTIKHEDGSYSTAYNAITILEKFEILTNYATQKKTKKLYSVKIGNQLKDFLLSEFNTISLSDYSALPNEKGYKKGYLYISRIRSIINAKRIKNEERKYNISVDQMAYILDINVQRNSDRKNKIKIKLNNIRKILKTDKFDYEFKTLGKYKYDIEFTIDDETLILFEDKSKLHFFNSLMQKMGQLYVKTNNPSIDTFSIRSKLSELLNIQDKDNYLVERKKFLDWFSGDQNKEEKNNIYINVYKEIYQQIPKNPFEDIYNTI